MDPTNAETPRFPLQVNCAVGLLCRATLSMPSRRIHRRALVGLGALLLVLSVWPFFCVAAIPVPLNLSAADESTFAAASSAPNQYQHQSSHHNSQSSITTAATTIINPSDLQTFLNLLNDTALLTDMNSSLTDPVASPTRSASTPNTALIIDDDNTDRQPTNATVRTRRRSLRDRIARKKSEKAALAERSHDEITFKIKSVTVATDLNLDESQTATTQTTRTIEMPDMQQSNTDILSNASIDYRSNRSDDAPYDVSLSTESIEVSTALAVVHQPSPGFHGRRNAPRNHRSISQNPHLPNRKRNSHLDRNERSANLSHIMGTARKIQLLMKNRLIQILPDGTVNGTQDDQSEYSKCTYKISLNNDIICLSIHTDLGHSISMFI